MAVLGQLASCAIHPSGELCLVRQAGCRRGKAGHEAPRARSSPALACPACDANTETTPLTLDLSMSRLSASTPRDLLSRAPVIQSSSPSALGLNLAYNGESITDHSTRHANVRLPWRKNTPNCPSMLVPGLWRGILPRPHEPWRLVDHARRRCHESSHAYHSRPRPAQTLARLTGGRMVRVAFR